MHQSAANPVARARVREWPHEPSIAHLVLLDVHMVPSAGTIDEWVDGAFESATTRRIRTGALFPAAAGAFLERGFVEVDRLALLERALHEPTGTPTPPGLTTSRLGTRHLTAASDIDRASFPDGWQHDAASLQEIISATPHARRRLVSPTADGVTGRRRRQPPIGFAITGCAGPNGYLQRLAVHPDARRAGAGRALVVDALDWLVRRGAQRALVNTGTTNLSALRLYEHEGFERLHDELVVLELARPT